MPEDLKVKVVRILDLNEQVIPSILNWPVGIFCGIAKPAKFKKSVADLGAKVMAEWFLADHQPVSIPQLAAFAARCKQLGAKALICTEKDFVKFPREMVVDLPILFLEVELESVSELPIWEKMVEKIDQKIDNHNTL